MSAPQMESLAQRERISALARIAIISLTLAYLVAILVLIVAADRGTLPRWVSLIRRIPMGDKVAHFGLYGMLALLFNLCLQSKTIVAGGVRCLLGSLVILVFTTLEESTQLFFQKRTFDLIDLCANLSGILILGRLARWKNGVSLQRNVRAIGD